MVHLSIPFARLGAEKYFCAVFLRKMKYIPRIEETNTKK